MATETCRGDLPDPIEQLTKEVLDIAFDVHTALGPGLLERAYVKAMAFELEVAGRSYELEAQVPFVYKGKELDPLAYRADILVEEKLVVEAKSVEELAPEHRAQALTVVQMSGCPVGLLLNFGATRLAKGIHRVIDSRNL